MLKFLFSKTFLLQLLIAFILIVAVIFGSYYFLIDYAKTGEFVEVPNLKSLDIIEGEALLIERDLTPEVVDSVYVSDVRGGEIIEQDPRPSSVVKRNRKIYLTISRYETPTVLVPNVLNQTSAIAISKLSRRGFEIGELLPKADPCDGCAIGLEVNGRSIEAESKLPQGSKIDIVVGQMNDKAVATVPMLYGLTLGEAELLLHQHNLNRGAYQIEDAESEADSTLAVVYYQSESAESIVRQGSQIIINLTTDTEKIPSVNIDSLKALIRG